MRGRGLLVTLSVLVAGVAVAQSIRPNNPGTSGGGGADLPLNAGGVEQQLVDYGAGFVMYDGADAATSTLSSYIYPGINGAYALDADTFAYAEASILSDFDPFTQINSARLIAFGSTYSTPNVLHGRDVTGGVETQFLAQTASDFSFIDVARGDGLSVGQSTTEWCYFGTAGLICNEGGLATLDFRVESDTDSDFLSVDASAETGTFGGVLINSVGAGVGAAAQTTRPFHSTISAAGAFGPYNSNTSSGTTSLARFTNASDLASSNWSIYSSTFPGSTAGIPNSLATDFYSSADMRFRADGGDIFSITGGTLLSTLNTTAWSPTVQTRGPAGLVGAPTYSFSTDTNTGIRSGGADLLEFTVGGVDRGSISTSLADFDVTVQAQGTTAVNIADSGGTVRGEILTRNGADEMYIQNVGGGGLFRTDVQSAVAGSTSSVSAGSSVFSIVESANPATGSTAVLFRFYGSSVFQAVPGAALVISGTPDTTSDPVTAGTSCRFSAASPGQTWTWPETNGVSGMGICCTNTGANDVTINDVDGQYEGPGSVVGQWDQVCAEYVTDRWVQRSFSDNEP